MRVDPMGHDGLADTERLYDSPSDAIAADFHLDAGAAPVTEGLSHVVAALNVVEKHLHPLAPAQLAALLYLKHLGPERLRPVADDYLQLYNLQAGPEALLAALESAALIRAFRGYSANVQSQGIRGPRLPGLGRGRF